MKDSLILALLIVVIAIFMYTSSKSINGHWKAEKDGIEIANKEYKNIYFSNDDTYSFHSTSKSNQIGPTFGELENADNILTLFNDSFKSVILKYNVESDVLYLTDENGNTFKYNKVEVNVNDETGPNRDTPLLN